LEGAAREWKKFRLELKRAIPGYATAGLQITIRDPASQCSIKCVESVCQFTAQLLSTEVSCMPIICNLDTCRFVTIGFERKSPNFLPLRSQQGTGDWLCGGEGYEALATRESREGGGKGAARKILRRVTKHGAEYLNIPSHLSVLARMASNIVHKKTQYFSKFLYVHALCLKNVCVDAFIVVEVMFIVYSVLYCILCFVMYSV